MKNQPIPQITPISESPLVKFNKSDIKKELKKIKKFDEITITYFGTTGSSAYILEKLIQFFDNPEQLSISEPDQRKIQFIIQSVVTTPDKPVGRNQKLTATPVAQMAEKYSIPHLKPEKLNDEFVDDHKSLIQADLYLVIFYGKIIPQTVLDLPRLGAVNVHPSLLPKYRGPAPVQGAILNGDVTTGVTIMKMDEKMDHGPIFTAKKVPISKNDTTESLTTKTTKLAIKMLQEFLPKFVLGKIITHEQDHEKATYTKLLNRDSGYFDIENPPTPEKLDRMIRAYYPWPNAWTRWKGKVVKLYPGNQVQMEGKKVVSLKEFLNGYPDFPLKNGPLE